MRESLYESSQQQYDVLVEKNAMIRMRDGVRLAADIYYPALNNGRAEGRFPTILERTPYNKENLRNISTAKFFARRGYVAIMQDVRGRFASEGTWRFMQPTERPDGYDTAEWIAAQPWSDGQVGTIGLSYTTATQGAMAVMQPPHLKAQFHLDGGYNYFTRTMRHSGAFEVGIAFPYVFNMARSSKEAMADPLAKMAIEEARKNIKEWLNHLPLQKGASSLRYTPSYEEWYLDFATHGDYDDFWKEHGSNIEEFIDQYADIPIFLETSWYGHHVWATIKKYVELTKRQKSPKKLLIGTWIHGFDTLQQSWSGDVDFGADSILDNVNDVRLKWFDHWLKGMKTDIMETPPIKIFVMGGGDGRKNLEGRMNHGGKWRDEYEWPLARTRFIPYYLHADGSLSPSLPGPHDPPGQYTYDPRDPVPTIGGNVQNPQVEGLIYGGAFDQRGRSDLFVCKDTIPLAARADVLVFVTLPLDRDVEVTGALTVKLWASSSAVDTDFTAKLIDVYPPNPDYPSGYAMNLADSIIRARYRNSREKGELMTSGEIYEFTIEPQPTSNLFKAGHRIRLDISSSNFPHFDVNSNTGEPLGKSRRMEIAQNTIYHDAAHPSHIVLPIIPSS
ncbi:MAG: CocE/NonD family hydrolase [Candidatus Tectomicrobia bacterium]|nr:CocE/NonD family hydrolase [Candidatus Tectomicrobia bacterium]